MTLTHKNDTDPLKSPMPQTATINSPPSSNASKSKTTALLLIDHGSVRREANLLIEQLAALIQKQRPEILVHFAHMEIATPTIDEGFLHCVNNGATEIIVSPYMLSRGRHASIDIPRIIGKISSAYPHIDVKVTEPLGLHEKIAQVILERANLCTETEDIRNLEKLAESA
ncbi:hypothetical protein BH10CYA1_BH10CYA1_39820 [soil metagenome]